MVERIFINNIIKRLEKFLITKSNYRLIGNNYGLIILSPSDKYSSDNKFSLLISSEILDNYSQKEIIREILFDLKNILPFEEYNALSRLNILHSQDPFVKNINFVFPYRQKIIEINNITIGGVQIDFAYLLKSLILDKLIPNHIVFFELNDGHHMKAGIKRIESNFEIVHYTEKGLLEMWPQNFTDEENQRADFLKSQEEDYLFANDYLSKTSIDLIEKII
jgi:hypothetical protein